MHIQNNKIGCDISIITIKVGEIEKPKIYQHPYISGVTGTCLPYQLTSKRFLFFFSFLEGGETQRQKVIFTCLLLFNYLLYKTMKGG